MPILSTESTAPSFDAENGVSRNQGRLMLIAGVIGLLFVPLFKTVTHLPPYMGMLLSLGALWVLSEILHKDKDEEDKYRSALRLRRSTALKIYNSVFTAAYPNGLESQDKAVDNYKAGKLVIEGVAIQGAVKPLVGVDQAIFDLAANKNKVFTTVAELMLNSGYNSLTTSPVALPASGSALLSGGATLPLASTPRPTAVPSALPTGPLAGLISILRIQSIKQYIMPYH